MPCERNDIKVKETVKTNTRRIAVILFLLIFIVISYINLRGSYLEYKELGENFINVYKANLKYQFIIMGINFIIMYTIMYFSGRGIKKGLKVFFDEEKKKMPKLLNKSIALFGSIILSVIVAIVFSNSLILWSSNTSFGSTDKVFNLDASFYVFTEPLIKMFLIYLGGILIGITLYSILYYIIVFNKYFDGIDKETFKKSMLMKSIFKNIKLLSIVIALYTFVGTLDIVFHNFLTTDNEIKLIGAGFIDSTIKLWGYIIFSILIVVVSFKTVNNIEKEKGQIFKTIAVLPAYLVCLFVIIIVFNLVFVHPNKYDKEKEYIEANIESTKKAYGIDSENFNIDYSGTVTAEDIQENQDLIDNAVIVNSETVLKYLNYNQTGAGYYKYSTIGIGKYDVNGKSVLAYVTPREIVSNKRAYNSKTYEYTHGYGEIITNATKFAENGEISYIQSDISGKYDAIKINTPQIYYGLETNSTAITNSKKLSEYDYTYDGVEYQTSYEGNSGLKLDFLDRLVLGIKLGDFNIAFSGNRTSDSKILINRNIIKRAKKALPNVIYDESPYTVIDENGDIYWVLDAYTTSNKYPYSTYTQVEYDNQKMEINYIRNSIKVIVNSYTGEMKFYITDRTDPIAMAYRNIYKDLFQDLDSKIPESISKQFVYPKFLYDVQASKLEEYHNKKADVLYRGDDTWEKVNYSSAATNKSTKSILDSYYTMVNENNAEEIGLIQVYVPKDKQNITSYLVGTVEDGKNILRIKSLSSDTSIIGPTQLDTQISQNEEIQNEINKLSTTGYKVTKNMIILPIKNTLLYIEPIYQTALNESNLPVLKKIIVESGNKVAIGNNLNEALANLLSQSATNIEIENLDDLDGLIESIIKANNNLKTSIDSKNLEMMGADIKRLQELINQMEKQKETKDKGNTNVINDNTVKNNENITKNNNIFE